MAVLGTRKQGLGSARERRSRVLTAGAVAAACALIIPAAGVSSAGAATRPTPKPSTSSKPAAKPSGKPSAKPSPKPSPSKSEAGEKKPGPDDEQQDNGKPSADSAKPSKDDSTKCDTGDKNNAQDTERKAKKNPDPCTEEEKKKKEQEEADKAASIAAAQELYDSASAELEKQKPIFEAAKKKKKKLDERYEKLRPELEAARAQLVQFARQTYMLGADPNILTQVESLGNGDPTSFARAQSSLEMVGSMQANGIESARQLVERIEGEKAAADAEFLNAKSTMDLVNLNLYVASATLGFASGRPASEAEQKFFDTYPVQECSFEHEVKTTKSCKDAQRFALHEVAMPQKSWDHLCLNLVTMAYGAPQSFPRAIDMWNGVPEESKHSPNTVAPAGALMFWAPNHVALSLGNNMLVSNDVLGTGRAWIVSFETIQARWNLPYLGWTDPDWTNG